MNAAIYLITLLIIRLVIPFGLLLLVGSLAHSHDGIMSLQN